MDVRLPLAAVAVLASLLILAPSFDKTSAGLDGLVTDIVSQQKPPDKLPDVKPPKDLNVTPPKELPKEIPPDLKISPELLKQLAAMGLDPEMGGMTGESKGNFSALPQDQFRPWNMDREMGADSTTCDASFDPALGCMKRLRSFDRLEADYSMTVADQNQRAVAISAGGADTRERATFTGRFPVVLSAGLPTPLFSVAADMRIHGYSADPPTDLRFLKDGADNYFVTSEKSGIVNLSIEVSGPQYYYRPSFPRGTTISDVPLSMRPSFPSPLRERVELVTDKLNITGETDYGEIVTTLSDYFNAFGEGEIPDESTYPDKFLAIALGEEGCCRHRAFAFMVVAQSYGIPTRAIANEGHAFVEVYVPEVGWQQINLGGCGSYTLNNPDDAPLFEPAGDGVEDPRGGPATEPEPVAPIVIPTITDIVEYTQAAKKGDPITVKGYVREEGSLKGVSGVPIDLFLNRTKDAAGTSMGHGRTDANGDFVIVTAIPQGLGAADYHLVSHAQRIVRDPDLVYLESWSDPILRVESASRIEMRTPEREGVGSPTLLQGRLLDSSGLAVDGRNVSVTVDGTTETVRTDESGLFARKHAFATTGAHRVTAAFRGDDHYSASSSNATVTVDDVSLHGEAEIVLVRGQESQVPMRLMLGPQGLPRATLAATLDLTKAGLCGKSCTVPRAVQVKTTDAAGNVTFVLRADAAAAPGLAIVEYVRDGKIIKTQVARIVFKPVLAVDAPTAVDAGENVTARLILVDDKGSPIPGAEVSATLVTVNGNVTFKNRTDARGVAEVTMGVPASGGSGLLQAAYDGDASAVPVVTTTPLTINTASQESAPVTGGLGTLNTLLFLIVPLAAVGGAAYFVKTRKPRRLAASEIAAGVRLSLRFVEIEDDLPDVWAPDSPITVDLRLARTVAPEGPIAGEVELKVDDVPVKVATDADGSARHTVAPEKVGEVTVEARHVPATGPWVSASRVLRLVDYRREIEREYEVLLEKVKAKGLAVKHDTTPRELEGMIVDTLQFSTQSPTVMAAGRRGIDEAVSVFEITNYGTRPLTREDYVKFYRARRAVFEYLGVES